MEVKVQIPGVLQDAPEGVKESYTSLANDNQRMFALQYPADNNGTKAAIRAGYSEKGAHVTASRLLSDAKIQDIIAYLNEQTAKRLEIDQESVLQAVAETAFSNIQDFFTTDDHGNLVPIPVTELPRQVAGAVKKIKITNTTRGQGKDTVTDQRIEFELYDRQKGAELLGKHLKLWTEVYEHMSDKPQEADLKAALDFLKGLGIDSEVVEHVTAAIH